MPDTPMTDARLDEIDASYDAADVGPWEVEYDHDDETNERFPISVGPFVYVETTTARAVANAKFVELARMAVPEMVAEIRRLRAEAERNRVQLVHAQGDLLDIRGHLSPNGYPRRVPMELGERVAPAVEWLLDRVDALETERDQWRARVEDWCDDEGCAIPCTPNCTRTQAEGA